MKILVGYKSDNEQTRAFRIVRDNGDGTYLAHAFMVMARIDGSKYLGGGNIRKISGLTHIEEIELEGVEE